MGYLRFSLILAVIYYHLAARIIAGSVAVYGFFVLSGYMVTLVSHEIYGHGWRSKFLFLANRAARVYPAYFICLILSLLAMKCTSFTTGFYHPEFVLPSSFQSWLVQFTIIGQSGLSGERWAERITLPAWSLSTEMVFYAIIGLLTGSSKRATTIAFMLSALATAIWLWQSKPYAFFYFSIPGPSIIFFTGAMFYHYHDLFRSVLIRNRLLLIMLTNLILYLPDTLNLAPHSMPVLYVTSFYLAYIIMCLHQTQKDIRLSRFEQFLADVTYPMFLLHWAVGAVIGYRWFGDYYRGNELFQLALPATFALSACVTFGIEMPMKKLRVMIRKRA